MISGQDGFNDATLEDAYVRGLPQSILSRSTPRPPFHPAWITGSSHTQPRPSSERVCRAETVNSAELSTFPQMNTRHAQTPTLSAMDIEQNKHRLETRSCYNCNEKGHILRQLPETWKQQIRSANQPNSTSKPVAEAVVAAMDARGDRKKAKNPKRVFRHVDGETHAPSDQQVLGLRKSTVGSTKDMLTHSHLLPLSRKPNQSCPTSYTPACETPLLVQSATLRRGTNIPLHLNTVDSNTPHVCRSPHDSGATSMSSTLNSSGQRTYRPISCLEPSRSTT